MFQDYFNTISQLYSASDESSEHTYRAALENMLNGFLQEYVERRLIIKQEPRILETASRPDFKVVTPERLTIGLLETKKIGEDLKKVLRSSQLTKYKELSDNIIVTDYLHFYLLVKGEPVMDVQLFAEYNLSKKRYKLEPSRIEELKRLLLQFFNSEPETIYRTQTLATKLSEKARFLKNFSYSTLKADKDSESLLTGVFNAFKDTLLPQLSHKAFSDIYAQTVTYGLFLSALNCDEPREQLNINTAYYMLPTSFSLIKELFHSIENFPAEITWAVDEIISILKVTDFGAIKREFSEYRNKEQGFNDPFIYFYEDFLKQYDKSQRELRGVYYTPEPVVSFIIRSIRQVLIEKLNIKDAFISKNVTLLDFATGTGTFLLNAFKYALEDAEKIADKQTVNKILNERLIPNFFGFELLVAPYVVAHLKISEFFKELGYSVDENNRLNIFLTNTLSNHEPKPFAFMPQLSKEGKEANRIKNQDVLVIIGNPPYSVSSSNKSGFIADEKMDRYKEAVKDERNIQPLSDDYIKFIRFAHWKMESAEQGIIGIITNNSFIDGMLHRGMREELLKDFDEVYVLNLHGNTRISEKSPDGSKDENIFDIMQGVGISLFVKNKRSKNKSAKVYYQDLYGLRNAKQDYMMNNDIESVDWIELSPRSPEFFFKNKDLSLQSEYNKGIKLSEIFKSYSCGVVSSRDNLVVGINKPKLQKQIQDFYSMNKEEVIANFGLQDRTDWQIQKALDKGEFNQEETLEYSYRPFDTRYIHYDKNLITRNRFTVMKQMIGNNVGFCFTRIWSHAFKWSGVYVSGNIADYHLCGGQTYFAPLYLYNGDENGNGNGFDFRDPSHNRKANFKKEFAKFIREKYETKFTPEQILGYIYAILHSPIYRAKYFEFLKIDFPRIPFVDDETNFISLSEIGHELLEHHLCKKTYTHSYCKLYGESDNFKIEEIKYENEKLWINKERYFSRIPQEIWEYQIGGYQVLDKWLKERKKLSEPLTAEDIFHIINMVCAIDYTIEKTTTLQNITSEIF